MVRVMVGRSQASYRTDKVLQDVRFTHYRTLRCACYRLEMRDDRLKVKERNRNRPPPFHSADATLHFIV